MLFIIVAFGVGNTDNFADDDAQRLQQILAGDHRSEISKARNSMRHPIEILELFRLKSDMALIEILSGGDWHAEVLAPFMMGAETYYAAHFSPNPHLSYQPAMLQHFEDGGRQ